MFVCEVCDGDSYFENDGLFYCNTCGSQSQEYNVEEQQEVAYNVPLNYGLRLTKKVKRRKKKHAVGKPWVFYEGLQHLMKAEVEALIAMGFDPRLKEVVGQIWFRFLQKKRVAFCEEEPAIIDMEDKKLTGRHSKVRVLPPFRLRDKNYLKKESLLDDEEDEEEEEEDDEKIEERKEKDENQPIKTKTESQPKKIKVKDQVTPAKRVGNKEKRKYIKKGEKKAEDFMKKLEEELERMDADFHDINDENLSNSQSDDDHDNDDDDDTKSVCSIASIGSVGSIKIKKTAYTPNTQKLDFQQPHGMCFCYIGLLELGEPVLVNDILRWAREGTIPYHKAAEVLPEEMKFARYDNKLFHLQTIPSVMTFFKQCRAIVTYLEMDVVFTKQMYEMTSAALIIDLGFDQSIWLLVKRIIENFNFSFDLRACNPGGYGREKYRPLDSYIGSLVVAAVKMVYYLDDKHEFEDICRQQMLKELGLPPVSLSWKQWVERSYQKKRLRFRNGIPKREEDLKYIENCEQYVSYCTGVVFESFQHRKPTRMYNKNPTKMERSFNSEARARYYNTFTKSVSKLNPGFNGELEIVPTSFPHSITLSGDVIETINNQPGSEEKMQVRSQQDCDRKETYILSSSAKCDEYRLDSYHYLLEVVADRIDVPLVELEFAVNLFEERYFEKKTI